uniref:Ankyrin repeat protein n=1 Tax=Marseillevirus LCMAC101 TaxID=2506602 RepID=A0A481YTB9_9VIRU|nr:MAG: ankyrin repeat protein [Marseillevirus LCMAC101]
MKNRGFCRPPVRKRLSRKFNNACFCGDLTTVLQLIDKVNINKRDEDGWDSLCHLTGGMNYCVFPRPSEGHYTIAKILVDFGINVDVKNLTLDGRYLTALESLSETHPEFKNEIEDHIYWSQWRGRGIKRARKGDLE